MEMEYEFQSRAATISTSTVVDNTFVKDKSEKCRNRGIVKCRAYRRRMKAQFQELQIQEIKLRQELLGLKQEWKKKKAIVDGTRSPAYLLYRDFAIRLRAERKHAESQNEKLRYAVNNQSMYIDTLSEILQKTAQGLISDNDYIGSGFRYLDTLLVGAPLGRHLYEIEAKFSQTNDVFSAFDPAFINNVEGIGKQGVYSVVKHLYPRSRLVLPFSLLETGNTMWTLGQNYFSNKENFLRHPNVNDPENIFVTSFVDTHLLKTGETAKCLRRFVGRRFTQHNQIVLMWKIIFEGEGIIGGVRVEETGWCRLLPSGDLWKPGTAIDMCVHRGLIAYEDSARRKSMVTDFLNLLTEESQDILIEVVNSLENVLLKDIN